MKDTMRRYSLLLLLALLSVWSIQAAEESEINDIGGETEQIYRFHADLHIDTKGHLTVTETIRIYAKGDTFKRGIVRSLPTIRNINGSTIRVGYDVLSVKKNGQEENYLTKSGNIAETYDIYVGEEDVLLSPGVYEYEITYKTTNQIGFFDQYDEIYWNVNGFGWSLGMAHVSATVFLPRGAEAMQNSCYTGELGSTASDCRSQLMDNGAMYFEANHLREGENLTIAVGFTKGIIQYSLWDKIMGPYRNYIFSSLFSLLFFLFLFISWRIYGRDPKKGTVYPLYSPPYNLSPGAISCAVDKRNLPRAISAAITNLCVKGYINISETREGGLFKKRQVMLLRTDKEEELNLPKEEKLILSSLFFSSDSFSFSSKPSSSLFKIFTSFGEKVFEKQRNLVDENIGSGWRTTAIFLWIVWFFIDISYLSRISWPFLFHSICFSIIFLILASIISRIFGYRYTPKKYVYDRIFVFGLVLYCGIAAYWSNIPLWNVVINEINIAMLCTYCLLIGRRSKEYRELLTQIEGFKMYLGTAERNQLEAFNPPKVTPAVFEQYLPYAIALDIADVWGKHFQSLLQKSNISETDQPAFTWAINGRRFSSADIPLLLSLVSNINSSVYSASLSSPNSSGGRTYSRGIGGGSSSSYSGSGGGGFSGGGGGGGGGGGW